MMKWTFALERIEGDWAILETKDGDTFQFPLTLLPDDIAEGTFLDFSICPNAKAQEVASNELANLRDQLNQT